MENNISTYFGNAGSIDPTSIDEFIENNFDETEVNEASNIYNDIFNCHIFRTESSCGVKILVRAREKAVHVVAYITYFGTTSREIYNMFVGSPRKFFAV